jgi:hypothetical protein
VVVPSFGCRETLAGLRGRSLKAGVPLGVVAAVLPLWRQTPGAFEGREFAFVLGELAFDQGIEEFTAGAFNVTVGEEVCCCLVVAVCGVFVCRSRLTMLGRELVAHFDQRNASGQPRRTEGGFILRAPYPPIRAPRVDRPGPARPPRRAVRSLIG